MTNLRPYIESANRVFVEMQRQSAKWPPHRQLIYAELARRDPAKAEEYARSVEGK